jgi:hypothetical protein
MARHLSHNDLISIENQMETNPGARYRIFQFQLEEMHEDANLWSLIRAGLAVIQIVLLSVLVWRLW